MPGKMTGSDPRPSVRVTRGAGSGQHLASVLQEGRVNANIDAGLGFIWRISVNMTLNESLQQAADRVLLRVVDSPGARVVHEFTGKHLLESEAIARLQPISGDSRIILLLLPHSPELFLLQIGLTLCGKVPAVLPWPTTR